jgi:hypothetical protein
MGPGSRVLDWAQRLVPFRLVLPVLLNDLLTYRTAPQRSLSQW